MTLLSICQDVADEIDIDQPSSVIGSTQPEVLKLLRYANKAGDDLMKAFDWQVLRKEQTFTSVATETQTSILPSDFDRFCPDTFWDRTNVQLWTGPVTAIEWQQLKAFSYSGDPKFAYRGGAVLAIPVPAAGHTLAFEYVSNQWCQSSGGSGQTAWAADTDTGVISEELIKRAVKFLYLTDEGLPNGQAKVDFDDYFGKLVKQDQPAAGVMSAGDIFGGRHFDGTPRSTQANSITVL